MRTDRLRRAIPPVAAWVAAAVVAVAVASWGVALVGRSVTDDRPAPLEAAQVEQRLDDAADGAPSTTSATATTGPSAAPVTPDPSAPSDAPATEGTSPTTIPSPGPTPTTTVPVASSPTTAPPPATTAPGETRTYALVGGTASLRFSSSGVTVVFANPAQGFDVDIEPEHGNGVRVDFESESHESRLVGWWQDGPRAETEERPDD